MERSLPLQVPQIYSHRETLSLEEAIGSALVNVRKAGFDVIRMEIEPNVVAQVSTIKQQLPLNIS